MPDRPSPQVLASNERIMLFAMLDWYRDGVVAKVDALDDAAAWACPTGSATSIAGLVNHLALVEDAWFTERFAGGANQEPWASAPWDVDPDWEFGQARREPLAASVERYQVAVARSRAIQAAAELDQMAARPSGRGDRFTLRWAVVHLLEETARHLGHLDILRELADGITGE